MSERQRIELRQIEVRGRLRELAGIETWDDEQRSEAEALQTEARSLDERLAAAIVAEGERESDRDAGDAEERERQRLRSEASVADFARAAAVGRAPAGASAEYRESLGIPETGRGGGIAIPLELLAPAPADEERTETDADTVATAASWLGRIFADAQSTFAGVTRRPVGMGVATFPVQATGPTPAQRARGEAIAAGGLSWTTTSSELKPKRMAVGASFESADALRLPGLEDQLVRDLRAAMVQQSDLALFVGDSGADGTDADLPGFWGQTAFDASGSRRSDLTQAQKILAANWLSTLAGYLDGEAAAAPEDVRLTLAVGAAQVVYGTFGLASNRTEQTIAQILRAQGYQLMTRGGIEGSSADGDDGAVVSLTRGIEGSWVHAVWEAGELVRDVYSDARSGGVRVTLSMFHDAALLRPANFRAIGFVT